MKTTYRNIFQPFYCFILGLHIQSWVIYQFKWLACMKKVVQQNKISLSPLQRHSLQRHRRQFSENHQLNFSSQDSGHEECRWDLWGRRSLRISFEGRHSRQSAGLRARLQELEFASCRFQNSLPCLTAVATGNWLSQQTAWIPSKPPYSGKGRHWRGLAPLLSEILHLCFLSAVWFSVWLVSTSGFFSVPTHTDLLPKSSSYLNSLGFLCCSKMAGPCDRWQEHLCWGGWQGSYGWGALQS